eukprot:CAMPEP_0195285646 /NCGR_PEP_ID=MMETSP0707-20130614/3400_1 /TAXON_ID=33640 /ORGANISM="Asterionellopsis glacialis, Strain CCMP134" /LENGTH=382 /DNA_ID=CAMNT_0040345171 /DNA_START=160 /DNA_END=1308 /DNA_ORIENTATION=+
MTLLPGHFHQDLHKQQQSQDDDDFDSSSSTFGSSSSSLTFHDSQNSLEYPMVTHQQQEPQEDDEEREDFLLSERGDKPTKKVRFVPSHENVIHSLSEDKENLPLGPLWYTRKEIMVIKKEQRQNLRAIKTAQQGLCELNTLKYCLRGLEEYQSKQKHQNKRKKVKATLKVVLDRQESIKQTWMREQLLGTDHPSMQDSLHIHRMHTNTTRNNHETETTQDKNEEHDLATSRQNTTATTKQAQPSPKFDVAQHVEMPYKISSRWALQKALVLGSQDARDAKAIYQDEFGAAKVQQLSSTLMSLSSASSSTGAPQTSTTSTSTTTTTITIQRRESVFREYKPPQQQSSNNKNNTTPTTTTNNKIIATNNIPRRTTVYARRAQTA